MSTEPKPPATIGPASASTSGWPVRRPPRVPGPAGAARAQRAAERVGWWPRLALAGIAGLAFAAARPRRTSRRSRSTRLLYAILAIGLNIAVGWAGLLDLGYIAFFGFGAYGYALFSSALGSASAASICRRSRRSRSCASPPRSSALVVGLASLRLSATTWRSSRCSSARRSSSSSTTSTPSTLGGVNGLFGLDPLHGFGVTLTTTAGYYYLLLVVCWSLADGGAAPARHSRTGRAWRAVSEDPLAAEAMTIPVNRSRSWRSSFGAWSPRWRHDVRRPAGQRVPDQLHRQILILIYACLVLGGAGSIAGAVARRRSS